MTLPSKTLRIQESETPGVYRFWIDGVDISDSIVRAEMILYYNGCEDEKSQTRLIIGARTKLPDHYLMTVHRGKVNGRRK